MKYSFVTLLAFSFLIDSECINESSSNELSFRTLKANTTVSLIRKNSISKSLNKFTLNLQEGRQLSFIDYSNDEDELLTKTYTYLGFSPQLNMHFIQLMKYESSDYIAVSKKGEVDTLWNQPYVSPQGKTVVSLSQGLEYEVYNNGFQIYQAKLDRLTKSCTKIIKKYEPIDLRWLNEKSFILKLRDPFSKTKPQKTVYRKYTLK